MYKITCGSRNDTIITVHGDIPKGPDVSIQIEGYECELLIDLSAKEAIELGNNIILAASKRER